MVARLSCIGIRYVARRSTAVLIGWLVMRKMSLGGSFCRVGEAEFTCLPGCDIVMREAAVSILVFVRSCMLQTGDGSQ